MTQKFKELLESTNIPFDEIARKAGLKKGYIHQIFSKGILYFKPETLRAISEGSAVPLIDIYLSLGWLVPEDVREVVEKEYKGLSELSKLQVKATVKALVEVLEKN